MPNSIRNRDLFGEELPEPAEPKITAPRGHAAFPGSGPKGETCGSCQHLALKKRSPYVYRKCWLAMGKWTRGSDSDIKSSDPACRLWVKADAPPQEISD